MRGGCLHTSLEVSGQSSPSADYRGPPRCSNECLANPLKQKVTLEAWLEALSTWQTPWKPSKSSEGPSLLSKGFQGKHNSK